MKILIVGLGGIGQRHVRNLRALIGPKADIIAFRYRNDPKVLTDQLEIEEGTNLVEKYAIRVHTDLGQALNEKPEVAFICNPTSLHVPVALLAARAGCDLFVEKPLSNSYEQVEELLKLVEGQNIRAVVGYQMRFHPCVMRIRKLIEEHAVGNIDSVRIEIGEYLPGWHEYEDYRQMYASRKDLGGGVILTQIHELDYAYWLFGFPKRLFAMGGHLSNLDIDVEDTASILMECVVTGRSIPISVHMDYLQKPPSRICVVVGDRGKIVADLRALTVDVFDRDGTVVENTSYEGFQRNQLFLDELRYFIEYLQGGPARLVPLREGALSLRIALAAKESLLTGRVVALAG